MVELVDEAFGGAGTVVAPKFEQSFGTNPRAGAAERARVERQIHASDPRTAATLRNYEGRFVERASTTEGLSGPHVERPGTQLFAAGEIAAQINSTLSDLPAAERADIARRLFQAQAVETVTEFTETDLIPLDRRALAAFRQTLLNSNFTATRLVSHTQAGTPTLHTYTFADAAGATVTMTAQEPDSATLIARGRAHNSRPNNFTWTMERRRNGDNVDFNVVGRRVFAKLHHRTLTDAGGRPYDPSTADPRFFARSTFQPPPSTTSP